LNNPAPPKEAGFFVAIVATKKTKKINGATRSQAEKTA
jgi:hypothetical protein